jgi:hypothetical protein
MPTIKFTARDIGKLKAPDPSGRQVLYWSQELKGFGVLVSGVSASKSYVVQHPLPDGRVRRVTVAPCNVKSLDEARIEAQALLGELWKGVDPKAGRRGIAAATLGQVLDDYLETNKKLRPVTREEYRAKVNYHLADWLATPMQNISGDMVLKRHASIVGEAAANLVMRTLRLLCTGNRIACKQPARTIRQTQRGC